MIVHRRISGCSQSSFDQLGFKLKLKEYKCDGKSHPLCTISNRIDTGNDYSTYHPGYVLVLQVPPTPSSFS
jgi:hypothetical protein